MEKIISTDDVHLRDRFDYWHDVRRTCGCRLLQGVVIDGVMRKLSMERVSKWLGHSSITVTERHYAFLTVDDLHEAVRQPHGTGRKTDSRRDTGCQVAGEKIGVTCCY
ncbi:MAG: hypothetical protein K2X43_13545 [Hyphomonadaceae bacterium]|nr:hypothetical protein [Hyphomonadaceae bacterium]